MGQFEDTRFSYCWNSLVLRSVAACAKEGKRYWCKKQPMVEDQIWVFGYWYIGIAIGIGILGIWILVQETADANGGRSNLGELVSFAWLNFRLSGFRLQCWTFILSDFHFYCQTLWIFKDPGAQGKQGKKVEIIFY